MIGPDIFTRYSATDKTYYLTVWQQPRWRRVIAKLYHRYSDFVFHFPGFRRLEDWVHHRAKDPWYIPWSNRQDIRCDHLRRKRRTELCCVEIDAETYAKLNKALYGGS